MNYFKFNIVTHTSILFFDTSKNFKQNFFQKSTKYSTTKNECNICPPHAFKAKIPPHF